MVSIQSFRFVPFRRASRFVVACVALATLIACSSSADKAAEAAAVAEFQFRAGNLAEAQQAINEAIGHKDDLVELHLLRGRIEFAAGDRAGAFDAYYNALALDPLNAEALQAVSQIGVTTGNISEAEDAADRILSITPGQPDALMVKGLIALARRRVDDALRYADEALTLQPANENARILKARALYLKGEPAAALATVSANGSDTGPVSEGVALTRLEIFRQTQDVAGMEREFTRLRNLRPFDSLLRIDEANYLFKLDKPQAANALLVRVLTQSPQDDATAGIIAADVARQAVDLWDQYGSREMSEAGWSQIVTGAAATTREIVARYLLADRRLDEAEAMIASLEGNARQALAARLQVARGDAQGGSATAAAVLNHDDTHCDALVAQSEAQLALRRPEAAVRYGQRAAAECPGRPEAAMAAALAYTAFERPSGSDRLFRDAIDANPQNLRIASAYADWLLGQGRERQAVATLRRYTRDTPASVKGWRVYADLCRRTRSGCEREAEHNRTRAARRYGIDLPPGQLQPNGLFGRFIER